MHNGGRKDINHDKILKSKHLIICQYLKLRLANQSHWLACIKPGLITNLKTNYT